MKKQKSSPDSLEYNKLVETIRKSVRSFLSENSFINEKEKQDDLTADLFGDEEHAPEAAPEATEAESPAPSAPPVDDSDEVQKEITVDSVIERLNAIRAGKSFKDDAVYAQMEKYFAELKEPERAALDAFLKGISQIITGAVEGEAAAEPKDPPVNVQMTKTDKVKHVKPNVISKGEPSSSEPNSNKEDTSAPAPVIAKKR
jgi:hypothetical protein